MLIVEGYGHREACDALELNPRTVDRWRSKLVQVGRNFFQFDAPYALCARYATDPKRTAEELRALFSGSPN